VKDEGGNFIHEEGISPVSGLYFIGRSWQRSRGSALVAGVGEDAQFIGVGEDAQFITDVLLRRALRSNSTHTHLELKYSTYSEVER